MHDKSPNRKDVSPLGCTVTPRDQVLLNITNDYLNGHTKDEQTPPATIAAELLELLSDAVMMINRTLDKSAKWPVPTVLSPNAVARCMVHLHHIYRVSLAGPDSGSDADVLAIYRTDPDCNGTYSILKNDFYKLAKAYNAELSAKELEETYFQMTILAPQSKLCSDPNLIPVENGLFNYETKTLEPFDPKYIFLSKPHIGYNPNASNITIHNDEDNMDWDLDSWLKDLADNDPEVLDLFYKMVGATLRPNVPWNKSVWLYSTVGNNGKGTLCAMIRELLGPHAHTSVKLSEFSQDFMLEGIIQKQAIITDENDVSVFIDKSASLKAIITNDVLQINRKYKTPISYRFRGFMIQCINDQPKMKDKSDSLYRRMLIVPMMKSFTGHERTYIKNDYLKRTEVLEYLLFKVLNMNYNTLPEPAVCKQFLEEYKEHNDTVRQYWVEFKDEFMWDLLPFTFLYDLYKVWFKQNVPSGTIQSRNTFITDLLNVLRNDPVWHCPDKSRQHRPNGLITATEPLILQYGLEAWTNPNYTGRNKDIKSMPPLKASYRGVTRIVPRNLPPSVQTEPIN